MTEEQELAQSLATYAAEQYLTLHSVGDKEEWLDITPDSLHEAVRDLVSVSARYLDLRGMLERDDGNPNLVRIVDLQSD